MVESCLYFGDVMHRRLEPMYHRFRYRVFSLYLDLDELPQLAPRLRLFSHNRWNLFSFFDRDHGPLKLRGSRPIREWVDAHLDAAGIDCRGGKVTLLCFPRVLGYVFNPMSVYFCHGAGGNLKAILYEVSNTFGQRHSYLLPSDSEAAHNDAPTAIDQSCEKRLYVSPFMDMAVRYRFRLRVPGERLTIMIRQENEAGRQLIATHTGWRVPLTDTNLLLAFVRYPLMTLKVIAAIHWEALKLWRKGARLVMRPTPPEHAVTLTNVAGAETPLAVAQHPKGGPG